MAFDFERVNLPKIKSEWGINAKTNDDGSVCIWVVAKGTQCCLTLCTGDAKILAKFLSDVYLEPDTSKDV